MSAPVVAAPRARRGRPSKLTEDVEQTILVAVRGFQSMEGACALAGVGRSTFFGWLQTAAKARDFLDSGRCLRDLTVTQRRCMDFSDSLVLAKAQAEAIAVRRWVAAGLDPQTTRTKRTKLAGMDHQGQPILVIETTEVTRPGDWRALVSWLERRVPAYRTTAEIEGDITVTLRAAGLAERVRAHQEGRMIKGRTGRESGGRQPVQDAAAESRTARDGQ